MGVGIGMGVEETSTGEEDTVLVMKTVLDERVVESTLVVDGATKVVVGVSTSVVVGGTMHVKSSPPNPVTMHTSSGSLHGLGSQGENDSLHSAPVKPGRHSQMNMPRGRSIQVALLKHGSGSQSSMSTEQRSPVKPCKQVQVWVELPSIQLSVPI